MNDNKYGLVDSRGYTMNVVIWDGDDAYDPSPYTMVPYDDLPLNELGVVKIGEPQLPQLPA